MGLVNYIKEIFKDDDGFASMKRFITFIAAMFVFSAYIANTFFHYQITQFILDNLMYIVIGGLGFVGLEKFAPKTTPKEESING